MATKWLAFGGSCNKYYCGFESTAEIPMVSNEKRFKTVALKKGRDAAARAVADCLFQAGILQAQGEMVVLNQEALQKYGVFYVQQNQLQFGDPRLLRGLYERCSASGGTDAMASRSL